MEITLNTTQFDATEALKGYQLYKNRKYREAIPILQDILDFEPKNWHARMLLGACQFRTNQPAAAQRSLRYVYEKCEDADLKKKACLALQALNAEMEEQASSQPAEFSGVMARSGAKILRLEDILV